MSIIWGRWSESIVLFFPYWFWMFWYLRALNSLELAFGFCYCFASFHEDYLVSHDFYVFKAIPMWVNKILLLFCLLEASCFKNFIADPPIVFVKRASFVLLSSLLISWLNCWSVANVSLRVPEETCFLLLELCRKIPRD